MSQQEKAGCLGQFLQMLGLGDRPEPTEPPLPYHLKPDFLSPAELNLYHVLRSVVGGRAAVLAKVLLGDLFYPKTGDRTENTQYRNKIDRKHVDFLLCEPQTMRPLAGIELDDASHSRADREERDRFVERVYQAARLPLVRIPAKRSYHTGELAALLQGQVGLSLVEPAQTEPARRPEIVPAVEEQGQAAGVPDCPTCGKPMVLRTVQREGPHYGKRFWGCSDFPRCRGVRGFGAQSEGKE